MTKDAIVALIGDKKFAEAQTAIAEARRNGGLSGAEARALGAELDMAQAAAPATARRG